MYVQLNTNAMCTHRQTYQRLVAGIPVYGEVTTVQAPCMDSVQQQLCTYRFFSADIAKACMGGIFKVSRLVLILAHLEFNFGG